ncbi:MAG: ABC transporter ATP-binding protein [Thermoplasmata archaeon]
MNGGETDAIRLEGVNKSYGSGELRTQVLFDINLSFARGTFNSIIGASGSGKTTLLNIIGTLDRPDSGEVAIDGKSTSGMGRRELAALRNSTIGFIFQYHYLLPEFTVIENVLMPRLIMGGPADARARERAEALLELVGLGAVKGKLASKISGGQQQRTAIARALMNEPKIILADEPTGNLDSENSAAVYRLFRRINRELGTTFVIVTHDRRIAEQTDRIVEIRDGRIGLDIRK